MENQNGSIREIGTGVEEKTKKVSLKETFIGDNDPYNDRHKDTEQYRRWSQVFGPTWQVMLFRSHTINNRFNRGIQKFD